MSARPRQAARPRAAGLLALALAAAIPVAAHARVLPTDFHEQIVVGNLFEPAGLAFLPDGRLLVIERAGRVRLVVNGKLGLVDPLLEPDSVDASTPEAGLLGIAVDPAWPDRPYLYLHATVPGQTQRVVRYRASGDLDDGTSVILTVDPASRYVVLAGLPNQNPGHNGGAIHFGPDGLLYVALGDDGVECAAQDSVSLRGVMLRLDVSALPDDPGGPPPRQWLVPGSNPFITHSNVNTRLVWAMGLRDPYRFQLDPSGGKAMVGDAGSEVQELDPMDAPGWHFGWPAFEGVVRRTPACAPIDSATLSFPAWNYPDVDGSGKARVVSGGIYLGAGCSGCDFPLEYAGDWFYADARVGFIRFLRKNAGLWELGPPAPGQPTSLDWAQGYGTISDLAVGADGALWYCLAGNGAANGEVGRIVYVPPTAGVPYGADAGLAFLPPHPIPMSSRVELAFDLARRARVDLVIVDVAGRRVRSLVHDLRGAGHHVTAWDGRSDSGERAGAGIYVARLAVDGVVRSRTIPLVR